MNRQQRIQELITRGVEQIIVRTSLAKKLDSGKRLRVKLGIDPTSPWLHLGHTVVLRKLRQFQDLGHQVIFLIGDFTARIGDPSDRSSARKPMTDQDITKNVETYKEQVGKVLDLSKVEIRYNMEWYRDMDLAELFQVASLFSVNQMLERDMFQKRIAKNKPLWIHEIMYPILQGYDSVALRADIELGGTDQTFNMLAARDIQPTYDQVPQDIMTVQLLEGTDGKEKMSKSIGNTINLTDSPKEIFGKIMSIPDSLIIKYFQLLTDVPDKDITLFESAMKGGVNPRNYKSRLGIELVSTYHGKDQAARAETEFNRMFKERKAPDDMPTHRIKKEGNFPVLDVIVEAKLAASKSEARRLMTQGGVEVDGVVVKDWKQLVAVKNGTVLKVGKRKFVKLTK